MDGGLEAKINEGGELQHFVLVLPHHVRFSSALQDSRDIMECRILRRVTLQRCHEVLSVVVQDDAVAQVRYPCAGCASRPSCHFSHAAIDDSGITCRIASHPSSSGPPYPDGAAGWVSQVRDSLAGLFQRRPYRAAKINS